MATGEGFYLTLPSDSNKKEFPDNTQNYYKTRLPAPIHLSSGKWEVGLSSVSMPDTKLHLPVFTFNNNPLFQMKWQRWKASAIHKGEAFFEMQEVKQVFEGINGVGFMKSVVNFFEQKRIYKDNGPHLGYHYASKIGTRLYIKFKWEGEELVTDNLETDKSDNDYPALLIDVTAIKMGWIKIHPLSDDYELGPNLKQEFIGDTVPESTELNDRHPDSNKIIPRFWYKEGTYFRFSYHCNWRFMNLNKAFDQLVGTTSRSLFVYSNTAQSSVIGNQVTDLLREVNYIRKGEGVVFFEPLHIRYIPVRNSVLDIIETQIAETDRPKAKFKFGERRTIVTLHFRRKL